MGDNNDGFPVEVAVAIAEIRTQMVSVNNHIRDNKDNYKLLCDKIDRLVENRIKKDEETAESINELEKKVSSNNTGVNVKFAFLAGIWAAVETIFRLKS